MENVLLGIEAADVYINDVGAFSLSWEQHIELLRTILHCLQNNGFMMNPLKCEWAIQEMNWLGYWLSSCDLKPWKKKIDTILHMDHPHDSSCLCHFIGCVNSLGVYPHHKVHIDIDPNAKPMHVQSYPVPQIHVSAFHCELDHLVCLCILVPWQESEWAHSSFIIPKKYGSVCCISVLHQLNKVIRCKQYPLPITTDILCKWSDTNSSQNLTSAYSLILLNLTKRVKISAPS